MEKDISTPIMNGHNENRMRTLKYYYKSIFGTVIVAHYSTFLYEQTQVQFIYRDTS